MNHSILVLFHPHSWEFMDHFDSLWVNLVHVRISWNLLVVHDLLMLLRFINWSNSSHSKDSLCKNGSEFALVVMVSRLFIEKVKHLNIGFYGLSFTWIISGNWEKIIIIFCHVFVLISSKLSLEAFYFVVFMAFHSSFPFLDWSWHFMTSKSLQSIYVKSIFYYSRDIITN